MNKIRKQVQAICRAAVRVLGASRFTAGRALEAMPDAVALSAEGPEREDLQLVWLIADGLANATNKLRSYCQAWDPEEFHPPSSGPEPDLPEGVRKLEGTVCLTDKGTIVVLGDPHDLGYLEGDGHPHSCDQMGCGSVGPHVLARGPVTGDAWPDSCVQTLLSLLDELLCRVGTHDEPDGSYLNEATALTQSVLCQTADWSHVEARLAELRSK